MNKIKYVCEDMHCITYVVYLLASVGVCICTYKHPDIFVQMYTDARERCWISYLDCIPPLFSETGPPLNLKSLIEVGWLVNEL